MYKYSIGHKGKLHEFSDANKDALLGQVVVFHRENNINFTINQLSKAIDRQSKIQTQKKKISLTDAIHGAKALLKYTSGKSVSNQEIERRSAICAKCTLMDRIGGCRSCGAAGAVAKFINTIRVSMKVQMQIPSEVRENYCGHCQCALALMVVTDLKDFREEDKAENAKRPDYCWLKTTNFNNP